MLLSEKERRTKNPSGGDDVAKEVVAGDKAWLDEEWDSTEYSTPGKDIGWQNNTAKTDVFRACVKDGHWAVNGCK